MKTLYFLAAAAAIATPLVAQTPVRSQIVRYADLQLGSPDGRAALTHRVRNAAAEVCGTASDFDLVGQNRLLRCRADTVAAAEQEIARSLAARNGGAVLVAARR